MLRQLLRELDFEAGKLAVFILKAERRIGSFQADAQLAFVFDLRQQVFRRVRLDINADNHRRRHHAHRQMATNTRKNHIYPIY